MLARSNVDKAKTSWVAITKVGYVADLNFFLDKSVDVAGKALKEKDIIFGEKFIAEHSTWLRRKLVTSSGLGIPLETTKRAIDMDWIGLDLLSGTGVSTALRIVQWPTLFLTRP